MALPRYLVSSLPYGICCLEWLIPSEFSLRNKKTPKLFVRDPYKPPPNFTIVRNSTAFLWQNVTIIGFLMSFLSIVYTPDVSKINKLCNLASLENPGYLRLWQRPWLSDWDLCLLVLATAMGVNRGIYPDLSKKDTTPNKFYRCEDIPSCAWHPSRPPRLSPPASELRNSETRVACPLVPCNGRRAKHCGQVAGRHKPSCHSLTQEPHICGHFSLDIQGRFTHTSHPTKRLLIISFHSNFGFPRRCHGG